MLKNKHAATMKKNMRADGEVRRERKTRLSNELVNEEIMNYEGVDLS